MINIPIKNVQAVRNGEATVNDLADLLLDTYPSKQIALALAELLVDAPDFTPITLSQEDYQKLFSYFKQRGVKTDGSVERRGRKRKDAV